MPGTHDVRGRDQRTGLPYGSRERMASGAPAPHGKTQREERGLPAIGRPYGCGTPHPRYHSGLPGGGVEVEAWAPSLVWSPHSASRDLWRAEAGWPHQRTIRHWVGYPPSPCHSPSQQVPHTREEFIGYAHAMGKPRDSRSVDISEAVKFRTHDGHRCQAAQWHSQGMQSRWVRARMSLLK
jgi:hypothetical protein